MLREEMEQLLVGLVYGELTEEEREKVEEEIARNPEWAGVLEELRRTSGVLRVWEHEEPAVRHLVSAPVPGSLPRLARRARPLRSPALLSAAAGIAAALLLILLNAEVGIEAGRFHLSLGREPAPLVLQDAALEEPSDLGSSGGPFVTEDDFLRSQAELIRFVAALLSESEDRQTDRFLTALAQYARDAEVRRDGDLVFMDRRLGVVEQGARDLLERVSADFPLTEIRLRPGDER